MRKTSGLVAVCLVVTLLGAVPARAAGGVRYVDQVFTDVAATKNIVYGQAVNSHGANELLKLDKYEPVGDEAAGRGLYIWVHGGNFNSGDKASVGPTFDYVRRGWVVMSINYRVRTELVGNALLGILSHPDQLTLAVATALDAQHDAQAAVRWARVNAASLRIDPNRIAMGGISAGAIIALMTAFNPNDAGNSGNPGVSSAIAAAVSHAGAYEPGLQGALPMPGAPPIAMFHGTNDPQVPYPLAPPACVLTLLVLNTCELVTFVGRGHETMGTDLARDFLYRHVIVGRSALQLPFVAKVDGTDPASSIATVVAGVEPPGVGVGADAGVVTPTDPNVIAQATLDLLHYAADVFGVPFPL